MPREARLWSAQARLRFGLPLGVASLSPVGLTYSLREVSRGAAFAPRSLKAASSRRTPKIGSADQIAA